MMWQRKGIYSHFFIKNINKNELNTEVKLWLKGRWAYLEKLWGEINETC